MRNIGSKVKCIKKTLRKSKEIGRTYSELQAKYAEILDAREDIKEIRCNVLLDELDIGDGKKYTSDFVCVRTDGEILVRECVFRRLLERPSVMRRLDASRLFWLRRGCYDWGLVTEKESDDDVECE